MAVRETVNSGGTRKVVRDISEKLKPDSRNAAIREAYETATRRRALEAATAKTKGVVILLAAIALALIVFFALMLRK
jgi:hypothetical protein